MTAESAQPRKASNVTTPFPVLWVGSGDETILKHVFQCVCINEVPL